MVLARVITLLFVLVLALAVPAGATNYYFYEDNPRYWIMEEESPGFQVLVPSDRAVYYERIRFGEKRIEIPIDENGPLLIVGSIEGYRGSTEKLRKSLVDAWTYLLTDVSVSDNREITTSKGLKAHFYAAQGRGEHGKNVMIRTIVFRRGSDAAYLSYTLDAERYANEVRQYWLEAVNSFSWK